MLPFSLPSDISAAVYLHLSLSKVSLEVRCSGRIIGPPVSGRYLLKLKISRSCWEGSPRVSSTTEPPLESVDL